MCYCELIVRIECHARGAVTIQGCPGLVIPDGGALVW